MRSNNLWWSNIKNFFFRSLGIKWANYDNISSQYNEGHISENSRIFFKKKLFETTTYTWTLEYQSKTKIEISKSQESGYTIHKNRKLGIWDIEKLLQFKWVWDFGSWAVDYIKLITVILSKFSCWFFIYLWNKSIRFMKKIWYTRFFRKKVKSKNLFESHPSNMNHSFISNFFFSECNCLFIKWIIINLHDIQCILCTTYHLNLKLQLSKFTIWNIKMSLHYTWK